MRLVFALALVLLTWSTSFADMVSVAVQSADLMNSPSSTIVELKVPRYYPLAVMANDGDYVKVSDYRGRVGWIHNSEVTKEPGVVVTAGRANVRSGPGLNHEIEFRALSGVALKVLETKGDWVRIYHESGKRGWIYRSLVWGL